MSQNIYDDEAFFAGYGRLPRSIEGLDGAPEWPALRALLPDLKGRNVLDLGCGYGWFCRWAREAGAASVLGIDISEKMLQRARATTHDDAIAYARADLEHLDLGSRTFDLVYSSLALHYVVHLDALFAAVHRALNPGGHFVYSAEHPIMTAPAAPGWETTAAGHKVWPVHGYLDEGPRTTDWITKGVIKQHRTLATTMNLLLRARFVIVAVEEWGPTPAQIAARPELALEHERPAFLLVSARRD